MVPLTKKFHKKEPGIFPTLLFLKQKGF